jgi:hypothetical protein
MYVLFLILLFQAIVFGNDEPYWEAHHGSPHTKNDQYFKEFSRTGKLPIELRKSLLDFWKSLWTNFPDHVCPSCHHFNEWKLELSD